MADIGDLFIRIFADGSQLDSGLNNAQEKLDIFGEGTKKLGKQIMEIFSVVAIEEFIRSCVDAADEAARATAKVAQALKNTGDASGQSLDGLKAAAVELQETTLFRGDTILTEVTSQLLTFSNIGVDSFKRAQAAALDMDTALGDGEGLQGMARLLGKALEDPIGGLNLLQRQLRIFTPDQRELIKNFMETNDIAGAQNVILSVVEGRYGGQAKAAADASNGLKQFGNAMHEVNAEIGVALTQGNGLKDFLQSAGGMLMMMFDKNIPGSILYPFTSHSEFSKPRVIGGSATPETPETEAAPTETTYADLTAKLKTYQEEFNDSTVETRAGIAQKIAAIKEEIKEWDDAGKAVVDYTGTIKGLENELSAMQTAKEAMPINDPMAIAIQTEAISKKQDEINVLKNASIAWVEYGDSLNTTINGRVVTDIDKMSTSWESYKSTTINTLMDTAASQKVILENMAKTQKEIDDKQKAYKDKFNADILQDEKAVIASVATTLGKAIGDVISGNESMGEAFAKVLGGLLTQVGEAAIAIGTTYLVLDSLEANPLDSGAALAVIGAGVAAVALGEILTNASKSSSASSGSSSSSGSASNTFDTRAQQASLYQNQTIELVQRGRDMVASIKLNQLYYNRQG